MITGQQLADTYRRTIHQIRRGKQIAASNQTGIVGNVQLQKSAFETASHDIWQHFGFASATPAGTDHALIAMAGDNSSQIAIASNHPTFRPKGMMDGESKQYDNAGQYVYCQGSQGKVVVNAQTEVDILLGGRLTATCNQNGWTFFVGGSAIMQLTSSGLQITGTITASGDITAGNISVEHHIHGGVEGGEGNTAPPQG